MKDARSGTIEVRWDYLENVQAVVLVGRVEGEATAIIELCPRSGFRLTECASGRVTVFQSLDEAKRAAIASPG